MMYAYAPNGAEILGTAEVVEAVALVQRGAYDRLPDGSIHIEYQGGSEVDWDSQKSRTTDKGERIFVDATGMRWGESDLLLTDQEETDPAIALGAGRNWLRVRLRRVVTEYTTVYVRTSFPGAVGEVAAVARRAVKESNWEPAAVALSPEPDLVSITVVATGEDIFKGL